MLPLTVIQHAARDGSHLVPAKRACGMQNSCPEDPVAGRVRDAGQILGRATSNSTALLSLCPAATTASGGTAMPGGLVVAILLLAFPRCSTVTAVVPTIPITATRATVVAHTAVTAVTITAAIVDGTIAAAIVATGITFHTLAPVIGCFIPPSTGSAASRVAPPSTGSAASPVAPPSTGSAASPVAPACPGSDSTSLCRNRLEPHEAGRLFLFRVQHPTCVPKPFNVHVIRAVAWIGRDHTTRSTGRCHVRPLRPPTAATNTGSAGTSGGCLRPRNRGPSGRTVVTPRAGHD